MQNAIEVTTIKTLIKKRKTEQNKPRQASKKYTIIAMKASSSSSSSSPSLSPSAGKPVPAFVRKALFEILGLTQQQQQQQEHHEHMELSQIELIYRAEGNANLVLALPQFKKVLRLPKMQQNQQQQQQPYQESKHQEQQQQQQQPELASTTGHHLNQKAHSATTESDVDGDSSGEFLTMEHFVAYIGIIRCLLGNEFIYEADAVDLPNPSARHWINQHIKLHRPVKRLDKGFFGSSGLLLPDATQLPVEFDILFSNLQKLESNSDTYAVEIKPKQGWLWDIYDINNLSGKKRETAAPTTHVQQQCGMQGLPKVSLPSRAPTSWHDNRDDDIKSFSQDIRCRYCSMQLLKLKQEKIRQLSHYCPINLFSGVPDKMFNALQALFECPQNNLRIYRNGQLIYDDHLSGNCSIEQVFPSDKLQIIKHLLVTCLLRDYSQEITPTKDDNSKANTITVSCVDAATIASKLHSTATLTDCRTMFKCENLIKQRLQKKITNADTITTTTITFTTTTLLPTIITSSSMSTEQTASTATTATTISFSVSPEQHQNDSQTEMLCLPKNCILQKILHLQLLAKKNFAYMLRQQYAKKFAKTYGDLRTLLKKFKDNHQRIALTQLTPEEEYLLAATALDCSIMITFKELKKAADAAESSSNSPFVVDLSAYDCKFSTKIALLDLDPKPDSHFAKYYQQTEEILNLFKT
ncbi:inositol phosphate kinase 1 isoform 2-T5 [Glossina fuscipes fuscipes]